MAATNRLTLTALTGIPSISAGTDLSALLASALRAQVSVEKGDIVVIAQKIVSKAEGRLIRLRDVTPSHEAHRVAAVAQKDPRLVELILRESREILRCKPGVIIVEHRLGYVMANAGIDASNVESGDESVLLLPENPDQSAARMRDALRIALNVDMGVIVNDSFGRAWRLGTVGTAIGVAGVPGLLDLRGRPDRNGRVLKTSELGVADEVAAAASLLMGQADEGRPVIHVRGFPYDPRDGTARDLVRPKEQDLFR